MYDRIRITPANLNAIKARYRYVGAGLDDTPLLKKDEFYIRMANAAGRGPAYALIITEEFDELITSEDMDLLSQVSV